MAHLGKVLSHFQVILFLRGHLFVKLYGLKILGRYKDHSLWLWLLFSIQNQEEEEFNKCENVVKAVTKQWLRWEDQEASCSLCTWFATCAVPAVALDEIRSDNAWPPGAHQHRDSGNSYWNHDLHVCG